MGFIHAVGRQFPDKAIDLIDEACSTTRMQIDSQRQWSATQSTSTRAVREGVLVTDHVAQVGILFLIIFVSIVQSM